MTDPDRGLVRAVDWPFVLKRCSRSSIARTGALAGSALADPRHTEDDRDLRADGVVRHDPTDFPVGRV